MDIHIDLNTDNVNDRDVAVLAHIALALGGTPLPLGPQETAPESVEAKPKRTRKVPEPTPEPTPEPEQPELPISDEGPTLGDAVSRATQLVSDGKAATVKAALAKVGAKRVSELSKPAQIEQFLAALSA